MSDEFDLGYYHSRFPEALELRYGQRFDAGFAEIKERFKDITLGRRLIHADDIMALFSPALPFVNDWTKPDLAELERKMCMPDLNLPLRIKELGEAGYESSRLKPIIDSLRELSLVALVLSNVYPARYAIVSHHIASILHVSAPTVPSYYLAYCRELNDWSRHGWPTLGVTSVSETEFALWTWYRLSYGNAKGASLHRNAFYEDTWVRDQRAKRIAESLGPIDKLDLARSYLRTEPTVAAMIGWRELEIALRDAVNAAEGERITFHQLIKRFQSQHPTSSFNTHFLQELWTTRNDVMHEGHEVDDARQIVDGAAHFLKWLDQER